MATFNKFDIVRRGARGEGPQPRLDILKVALANTLPLATNTQSFQHHADRQRQRLHDRRQPGGAGELAANGRHLQAPAQRRHLYCLGGSIAAFQYVVLYNDTATNKELIGWYDYGTALTVTAGNSFTVDFDGTNGVLTIT